ncbi:MAG: T9SS type A sorting domain-containing protein [Cyclobacteriaceae bacterium]|nr:T9SS type A sorting domain-containing protein [Cyclobacteriaceae bacterium]
MLKRIILLLTIGLCANSLVAQKKSSPVAKAISSTPTENGTVYYGNTDEPPRAIRFKEGTVSSSEFIANIRTYFNIPAEYSFAETESSTDQLGMHHRFLQQYYKGIAINGMGYRMHEKDGFVKSANGKAVRKMNIDIETRLSEAQAFQLAVKHLQTKDTTVRQGNRVVVSKNFTFTPESFSIAYVFDIDVSLIERWRISIDARSGQVINKVSLVQDCFNHKETTPPLPYGTGTGITNYYGTQTIQVEKFEGSSSSHLYGLTENGGKIGTYDFQYVHIIALILFFQYTNASYFYSPNNSYDDPYQKSAVSVHWAAEKAYEYYFNKHGRNSFDNFGSEIKSYVHIGEFYDNALWNGKILAFGEANRYNQLVELDVVSHELTHGVTQYEAKLSYSGESGALNESFSDIMAKAVEFDTFGDTATWQLAKYFRPGGLRDFSNPNFKNQPDTWLGNLWYSGYEDNGGVHTNSGVQNFWYYLLCEGGSGVNDHAVSYTVASIGMDAATQIAYRNLTEYLGSYSDYLDSRVGSLLATEDLYGKNSSIYQQVVNAWDAVGVIDEPIINKLELSDITATTVKIKGNFSPRGPNPTYHFEYGTTPSLGTSTNSTAYIDKVDEILTGLKSETHYYLRLVASNENGSSYSDIEFTTISLAPLVTILNTVDVTETTATLYGQINPNSLVTSFYFEYGLTPELGQISSTYFTSDTTEFINVSATINNLQPRKTYYYKLIATNAFAKKVTSQLDFFTADKPVILSFTPIAARVGAEVTIIGDNFNLSPDKNVVSFGATRAEVVSGSATQLKVKVPNGATFGSISLLDAQSGLRTESIQEFVPTFNGDFTKNDLSLRVGIKDVYIDQTWVEDMDGDGKPDIVASHFPGFSIYQNVNHGEDITIESFVRNVFNVESNPIRWLVDLDGNGLKDAIGTYSKGFRIYPNLSVPGFLFFGSPIDVPTRGFFDAVFADFDQDGRIDVATMNSFTFGSTTIDFIRNQKPTSSLSAENFSYQNSITLPYYPNSISTADFNNDGSPELIIGATNHTQVPILKNETKQPGAFEFVEVSIEDPLMRQTVKYNANDLNQDGWKDLIAYSSYDTSYLRFTENKSNLSNIVLTNQAALNRYAALQVKAGDMNGDGKVDLIVGLKNRKSLFIKNNNGSHESLSNSSFEQVFEYGLPFEITGMGISNTKLNISDLNGDGRPEVIAAYTYNYNQYDGNKMEIWQNKPFQCLDPSFVQLSTSLYTATVSVPANTTLDQYQIDYSVAGSNNWFSVASPTFSIQYGVTYTMRVRAKCFDGFTEYYYRNFTADCANTNSFSVNSINATSVSVTADGVNSLEIGYSIANKNEWATLPYSNYYNITQINNLLPGTTYDIRFRGRCNFMTEFKYKQFTTICPSLTSISISDLQYNSATVNWTSNYTGPVNLEYSTDNSNWTLVGDNGSMFPLIPAKTYFVRGRFNCSNFDSEFLSTSFTTPCPKVSSLSLDVFTPFSVEVSWVDESNTGKYTVSYALLPSGSETTIETSSTSYTINGLSPGTSYYVRVAPYCTKEKVFISSGFTTVCYYPFSLIASKITQTSTLLYWSDSFEGVPYSVDYSIAGSGTWQTITSPETTQLLEGLRPATKYEVRVHINCPSVKPDYASIIFETNAYGETTVAPNPTDKSITLFPSKNLIGNLFAIYDNSGKQVISGQLLDYTFDLSVLSPGFYTLQIDGEKPLKILKK